MPNQIVALLRGLNGLLRRVTGSPRSKPLPSPPATAARTMSPAELLAAGDAALEAAREEARSTPALRDRETRADRLFARDDRRRLEAGGISDDELVAMALKRIPLSSAALAHVLTVTLADVGRFVASPSLIPFPVRLHLATLLETTTPAHAALADALKRATIDSIHRHGAAFHERVHAVLSAVAAAAAIERYTREALTPGSRASEAFVTLGPIALEAWITNYADELARHFRSQEPS